MKWLGKLFKKKQKVYNVPGKYKLLIIDDEADLLHENLGIISPRAEELLKACMDSFENNKRVHTALAEIVDKCCHTNEIVFATIMMAKIIDRNEQKNRLHDMLKDMFGNG
jgi:hypothetical protein